MQPEDIAINLVTSGVIIIVAFIFVLIWKKQTNGKLMALEAELERRG